MTKRRRRKPEQIVKLLQEGEAMLSVGKTLGENFAEAGGQGVDLDALEETVRRHEVRRSQAS